MPIRTSRTPPTTRLNLLASAKRAHELTGATVLLKGAVTIVVDEDHVYASGSAPAWLAPLARATCWPV